MPEVHTVCLCLAHWQKMIKLYHMKKWMYHGLMLCLECSFVSTDQNKQNEWRYTSHGCMVWENANTVILNEKEINPQDYLFESDLYVKV